MNRVSLFLNRFCSARCSLFLLLTYLSAPVMAGECVETMATATAIEGIVEKRQKPGTAWEKVMAQDTFCVGNMVRTQLNSRAALYLNNNSILRLNELSTVTFTGSSSQGTSQLNLKKGIAHFISRIKQRFEVLTPYVNAAVDGTEFVVAVDTGHSNVTVLEGRVRVSNEQGEISLTQGETALARAGKIPSLHTRVQPWGAVSWALYYPAVSDFSALLTAVEELPEPWHSHLLQSFEHYQQGQISVALTELESLPDDLPNSAIYVYRAALHLAAGQTAHASIDLESALKRDAGNGEALALKAIIAVTQNRTESALKLARDATDASPKIAATWLAQSDAQQAVFDLEQARFSVKQALKPAPENALVWARLAELQLMSGELEQARQTAQRAAEIAPRLACAQSVLGFAHLTRIEIAEAEQAFNQSIELDQAAPLPRLGLGLAMIRRGELAAGRRQIEIAASLSPANSLIRSYLGKAYYEEKRGPLDATQLAMAKELDPNDPTPWFYDAIRKQTENRPIEALQDLEKSTELNDNRAVYRSRLLLDEDQAAKNASQARIYSDLGFQQLALAKGGASLTADPTNHSAHRFLADAYASLPRHQIARVSELLQAQLWQPLNLSSLQAQSGEANLGILEGAGPSVAGYNEFNSLFTRNRIMGQVNGITGADGIRGSDLLLSGIHDRVSFSLGRFHYESDGFRENNDQQLDIYNLFIQASLSHKTSIQAELKTFEREKGDLVLRFDPDDVRTGFRETEERESLRIGLRHDFSPRSRMIVSLMKQQFDLEQTDNPVPGTSSEGIRNDNARIAELQHVLNLRHLQVISGLGYFKSDSDLNGFVTTATGLPPPLPSEVMVLIDETGEHSNSNLYSYLQGRHSSKLDWLLGLGAVRFDGALIERKQLNPKLGLRWQMDAQTTLRMAAFRTLKRDLVSNQTVEPTQVMGFNQLFDDDDGTDSRRYGVAIDRQLARQTSTGFELSQRHLKVPFKDIITDQTRRAAWREDVYRAYLHHVLGLRTVLRLEYQYEKLDADEVLHRSDSSNFTTLALTTQSLPLEIEYSHPAGWSLSGSARYVEQKGVFGNTLSNSAATTADRDHFWLVDAGLSYRLPGRYGKLSLQAKNLLDTAFLYQESDPENPTLYPERLLFARLNLSW